MSEGGGPFTHRPMDDAAGGFRCRVCGRQGASLPLPGGCPQGVTIDAIHDQARAPLVDARAFEQAARWLRKEGRHG